ncbi:MAG TPA: hypothetical protein VI454_08035, partial [Verrucomicrobiae bacterium]
MSEGTSIFLSLTPKRIVWICVALVLVVGGGFSARPAYRQIKKWRAQRLAAEGEALRAANSWEPALRKAQQALQLSSAETSSLRLMSRVLAHFGHEQTLPYWR